MSSSLALTMRLLFALGLAVYPFSAVSAASPVDSQRIGMFLHGNWTWSVDNCVGIARNKRYWFFLKEHGRFTSLRQIKEESGGRYFQEGWQFMQRKSDFLGRDSACDFAINKWPAMLWRKD